MIWTYSVIHLLLMVTPDILILESFCLDKKSVVQHESSVFLICFLGREWLFKLFLSVFRITFAQDFPEGEKKSVKNALDQNILGKVLYKINWIILNW